MAVIKSGDSSDQLKIDSASKAARTTLYDIEGNPVTPGTAKETGGNLDSINSKLGEVQDSPTAYTLLARLKNIYTILTGNLTVIVKNIIGNQINPATEDTLALIKTTDGIKKITDPITIKGTISGIGLEIDDISKAGRITLYNSNGKEIAAPNSLVSKFSVNSGNLIIQATAHAATAGFFWLINPVGNTKNIKLRRVECQTQITTALVTLTAPRINIERMTFTGTSSGAQITPTKIETSQPNATGLLITASTGLTPSAGAIAYSFLPVMAITAVGAQVPVMLEYEPPEEAMIVLVPGEGIVCRQADAGTASDTRKLIINLAWQEYTP